MQSMQDMSIDSGTYVWDNLLFRAYCVRHAVLDSLSPIVQNVTLYVGWAVVRWAPDYPGWAPGLFWSAYWSANITGVKQGELGHFAAKTSGGNYLPTTSLDSLRSSKTKDTLNFN